MTKESISNVKRLVIEFMACLMVPPGGTVQSCLQNLTDHVRIKEMAKQAQADALAAIRLIKEAPDNPYGDDDEVIAGIILQKIEEKKSQMKLKQK